MQLQCLFILPISSDESQNVTVSVTSPGDDLDSHSPVSSYVIRVFDGDHEIQKEEAHLAGEHILSPVPGGEHKKIKIKFVLISCVIFIFYILYLRSRSDTFSSNVKYRYSIFMRKKRQAMRARYLTK